MNFGFCKWICTQAHRAHFIRLFPDDNKVHLQIIRFSIITYLYTEHGHCLQQQLSFYIPGISCSVASKIDKKMVYPGIYLLGHSYLIPGFPDFFF